MDALHGLSAVAASMPRLNTKGEASRQREMSSAEAMIGDIGTTNPQVQAQVDANNNGDHDFLYIPKSSRMGSSPLRKHNVAVGADAVPHAPAAAAAASLDAVVTTPTAGTAAFTLYEESNLIRLEQARRRSLLAAASASINPSLPSVIQRHQISVLYEAPTLEQHRYLIGQPSTASLSSSSSAIAATEAHVHKYRGQHHQQQQQLLLQESQLLQSGHYDNFFRNDDQAHGRDGSVGYPTADDLVREQARRAVEAEVRIRAVGLLSEERERQRLYAESLLAQQHQRQQQQQQQQQQFSSYQDQMQHCQPALYDSGVSGHQQHTLSQQHPRVSTFFLPSDSKFLSESHCFLRSICIEPFIATSAQVDAPGKGARPSFAGQVGFRCIHCRSIPKCQQANQAVCYPSARDTIFESVRNFQRVHLNACPYMAPEIKQRFRNLVKGGHGPRRSRKLVRAYYAQAAGELGLVDTPHGMRYGKDDGSSEAASGPSKDMLDIIEAARAEEELLANKVPSGMSSAMKKEKRAAESIVIKGGRIKLSAADQDIKYGKFTGIAGDATKKVLDLAREEATPYVLPLDFENVSDFVYLLFHQLLPCKPPTAATIKRRRLKVDQLQRLPGLCCKHCHQNDGMSGMYFPLNIESLGDSSFSQTLLMHLRVCSFVPNEIKEGLVELKDLGRKHNSCVKRGSKKMFIDKVWARMKEISEQGINGKMIVGGNADEDEDQEV